MPSRNSYNIDIKELHNPELERKLKLKIDKKPGPLSGLGFLSDIALQLGMIKRSETPVIKKPSLLIFAADHGVADSYVIPDKKDATHQKVQQFLNGNHPVLELSKKHKFNVRLIDVGVNHSFEKQFNYWLHAGKKLLDYKIAFGTNNLVQQAAMSTEDCLKAIETGRKLVIDELKKGCDCIAVTQICHAADISYSVLNSVLNQTPVIPLEGFENHDLQVILQKVVSRDPITHDAITLLSLYGGFEIAAACGIILECCVQKTPVLIEGKGGLIALQLCQRINKASAAYVLITSVAQDSLSRDMLRNLNANPILTIGNRESEGIGIILSYPIMKQAERLLKN